MRKIREGVLRNGGGFPSLLTDRTAYLVKGSAVSGRRGPPACGVEGPYCVREVVENSRQKVSTECVEMPTLFSGISRLFLGDTVYISL